MQRIMRPTHPIQRSESYEDLQRLISSLASEDSTPPLHLEQESAPTNLHASPSAPFAELPMHPAPNTSLQHMPANPYTPYPIIDTSRTAMQSHSISAGTSDHQNTTHAHQPKTQDLHTVLSASDFRTSVHTHSTPTTALTETANPNSPYSIIDTSRTAMQSHSILAGTSDHQNTTHAHQPTIENLRTILSTSGFRTSVNMHNKTVEERLHELGTSLTAVIETAKIAENINHPIIQKGGLPSLNRYKILQTLLQLFTNNKMSMNVKQAIAAGNNDPEKIATNIIFKAPYS